MKKSQTETVISKAKVAVTCSACEGVIYVGDKMKSVPNKGIYHLECGPKKPHGSVSLP